MGRVGLHLGRNNPLQSTQAGDGWTGEQLCSEGPGGVLVGDDHEPATCPGNKESQQHPGLLEQEKSQEAQVIFPLYSALAR